MQFNTIKLFDDRLTRHRFHWNLETVYSSNGDRIKLTLNQLSIDQRQSTRHRWKTEAVWNRFSKAPWEYFSKRKIDFEELKTLVPDDVKEWVGVSMIVAMETVIEEQS